MQEDYLHYLWEFQKWNNGSLFTTEGLPVTVLSPGSHNFLSGPDFFNSRVVIAKQEWAGNVEIHINSSHWFAHGHQEDAAYEGVILHVVWEHDREIFRSDGSAIPVLEIKSIVDSKSIRDYENLIDPQRRKWINCENEFPGFDDFTLKNWLERLYIERLEKKSEKIFKILEKSAGDWEEVLFKMLARNFGLNINGEAFKSIADSIPFSVVRKLSRHPGHLEAALLGQAGLLDQDYQEDYFRQTRDIFSFTQKKFGLRTEGILPVRYFRLRPDNFPEIRLAQLAAVYEKGESLCSNVIAAKEAADIRTFFDVEVADFWNCHYTFKSGHKPRKKMMTAAFLDLLLINTVVPVKFCYLKKRGTGNAEELLEIMMATPPEKNKIISNFREVRPAISENALESQALLELKKEYCDRNRCLSCTLGLKVLNRKQENLVSLGGEKRHQQHQEFL